MERKECANRAKNNEKCTCRKFECERHGVCCECVLNHLQKGNLPVCFRTGENSKDN